MVQAHKMSPGLIQIPDLMQKARRSQIKFSQTPIEKRLEYLRDLRHYIVDHLDDITAELVKGTGKPKVEALTAEILTVVDGIRYLEKHSEKALKERKVKTPITLIGKKSYISYEPKGVVLVISPWNFPFQLSMIPVLSAFVAGNAVILKPSEVTPLVGEMMERLFHEAGFPEGVIRVVHGNGEVGAQLIEAHPDYIFFTGSGRTGRIIQTEAAKRLIPTTLELGGKDPMIVFKDAHLDRAVKGAVWGGFTNSGQVCMGVERIYVERPIYDPFVEKLVEEVASLTQDTVGDGDLGSITFPRQIDIVREQVQVAISEGAQLKSGLQPEEWDLSEGLLLRPMILTNVSHEMQIVREETFGPVISIIPFKDEEEVLQKANDTPYGLNASVWSNDIQKAKRIAQGIRSGAVVINDVIVSVANPYLPFGGVKESGIGRYRGDGGLHVFCDQKSLVIDRGRKGTEVNWFPYKGKWGAFRMLVTSLYGRNLKPIQFVKAYLELLKKSK